jgi:hypothetical protein
MPSHFRLCLETNVDKCKIMHAQEIKGPHPTGSPNLAGLVLHVHDVVRPLVPLVTLFSKHKTRTKVGLEGSMGRDAWDASTACNAFHATSACYYITQLTTL